MVEKSKIIGDKACPVCRENGRDKSGNHLILFEGGGAYCNRCNYKVVASKEEETMTPKFSIAELPSAEYCGISEHYMEMYGYKAKHSESTGELTTIFYPLTKNGKHSGWKVRDIADKKFATTGDAKDVDLIGMQVDGGKRLCVIVEGENDAAAAKQLLGNGSNWYDNRPREYTVVSVPYGGGKANINKYSYEWLAKFQTIIIATDMDDKGEELAQSINLMFGQGKCRRAVMPVKDAHDCLTGELGVDFCNAITNARAIMADGIIMGDDYFDELLEDYRKNPDGGLPYPAAFDELNKMVYGMRKSEVDLFTSGSGMGKSSMFREVLHHITNEHDLRAGVLSLEEPVSRTLIGQLSITDNRPLHLPEVKQTVSDEELRAIYDKTATQNLVLYDHFGGVSEESLMSKIRYMAVAMGCEYIMLDHVSIVISEFAAEGDERRMIDELMTKLANIANELDIWIGVISHLRKAGSGPSFEEGAVPSLDDLRGSGSLKQLSYQVIALSRNQQDPDPVRRNTTRVTVLKNRFCGRTGPADLIYYDDDTGRMVPSVIDEEEWNTPKGVLERTI